MTAMWLLPVVTLIVASSSGAVVANTLSKYSEYHALITTTISAFLVIVGLTLALMILTIYFLRLIVHGLPAGGTVLSVFLPLGPTGQAGYSIFLIGDNFTTLFPTIPTSIGSIHSNTAGSIVKIICICLSFALWSLATMWILYALLAMHTALRKSFIAFRVSFWGLVFPNVSKHYLHKISPTNILIGGIRQPHDFTRRSLRFKSLPRLGGNICCRFFAPLDIHIRTIPLGVESVLYVPERIR